MKTKVKVISGSARTLIVEIDESVEFLYQEAESLREGNIPLFFPLTWRKKKKGYCLEYDLGLARPLSDFLKTNVSSEYVEPMLKSFLDVVKTCSCSALSTRRILFDPKQLYFDPSVYKMRFVYYPFRNNKMKTFDPLIALEFIAEGTMTSEGAATSIASKVLSYARSHTIFSWPEYENLLCELGILHVNDLMPDSSSKRRGSNTKSFDCRGMYGFDFMQAADSVTVASGQYESSAQVLHKNWVLIRKDDGVKWSLHQGRNIIGRMNSCDIALQDVPGLSREHVVFVVQERECLIEDLGSTNGCRVNGRLLRPHYQEKLYEGDEIQIAKTPFLLQYD